MNRRNLFIGSLVAGLLALPLLAAAQGSSAPSSGAEAVKPATPAMQASSVTPAQHASTQPAATAKPATSTGKSSMHHSTVPKVDLNPATREELVKLPGIGEAIADKIIAARPFKSKDELVSRKLVSESEYKKISSHVIAKQPLAAK
jgi:DNA uptake protein ComE-like DNA-binding protein